MKDAPGPTAEELTRDAIAKLRHDLRTPINHLLGYSEMLMEEAAEDGHAELAAGCEQIRSGGRQLLERISEALSPSRTQVTRAELRQLAAQLQMPLADIANRIKMLVERADLEPYLADLQKLKTATRHLAQMSSTHLGGAAVVNTPGIEPDKPTEKASGLPRPRHPQVKKSWGRLLVVDDIEANRDVLCRRLEREGYASAAAENGRQALEMIRTKQFDLVLLDVMMPEIDGYQVLEQVKAAPELRDIPIIMISALDEIQSVVRCIEMGAEDYLPKPFDPVLLRARVGACLEKKRLRDQELEYLRNVGIVTTAAAAVQAGSFEPQSMAEVAGRSDALGQLARVFQQMGQEVQAREQRLRQEVQQLRVEIDQARRAHHVAEITETDYFQQLQERARALRQRTRKSSE